MTYVYGSGNGGRMWAEIAKDAGITIAGFVDDYDRSYPSPAILSPKDDVIVAIYDNKLRLSLVQKYKAIKVIHPKAHVFESAVINKAVMIKPFAMVGARTTVGEATILDSGVLVEHDSRIDKGVYISVGSRLGSKVDVGEGTLIGINCTIQSGVTIGKNCVINSGSVVFYDVPDGKIIKPRI